MCISLMLVVMRWIWLCFAIVFLYEDENCEKMQHRKEGRKYLKEYHREISRGKCVMWMRESTANRWGKNNKHNNNNTTYEANERSAQVIHIFYTTGYWTLLLYRNIRTAYTCTQYTTTATLIERIVIQLFVAAVAVAVAGAVAVAAVEYACICENLEPYYSVTPYSLCLLCDMDLYSVRGERTKMLFTTCTSSPNAIHMAGPMYSRRTASIAQSVSPNTMTIFTNFQCCQCHFYAFIIQAKSSGLTRSTV